MRRQVVTIDDPSNDRQPPVERLGSGSAQVVKNHIWNFISRLITAFRIMLPQMEEDTLFSETTPPSASPPWNNGETTRGILTILWELVDRTDFRLRYAFGLIENNFRALTQRVNLTTNWVTRLARRVGRMEELLLILDRSLALAEEQIHQLLFKMPKDAKPKVRPGGSGKPAKAASSTQRRSRRLSKLQKSVLKKRRSDHSESFPDRLMELESQVDKISERVRRLQKQMRNLEKTLREQAILDGALSESEPSEMD